MVSMFQAVRLHLSGLAQQPNFLKLWAGQTISLFGSQITFLALPLIAATTLHATPAQMAALNAVQYAPAVLLGLFAGVWVDRVRRQPLLIIADLGRAALLFVLPCLALLDLLRIEVLYGVAFSLAVLGVLYGIAYGAFLPALVPKEHLITSHSRLATSSALAQVAGPGIAGVLVQLFTAPIAVVIDACSFLLSACFVASIRTPELAPPSSVQQVRLWHEVREGLRVIVRNPYLRTLALSSATLDIFWNALFTVYVLFVNRELELPPAALGLIFGIGSVGGVGGSIAAAWMVRRVGLGPTLVWSQIGVGFASLLIPLASYQPSVALPLLIGAECIQSTMNTIYGVNRLSLTQAVTPDRLLGRVSASNTFFGLAPALLGSLLGGILGERIGVVGTITIGAFGGAVAFLWLVFSPIATLRTLPSEAS